MPRRRTRTLTEVELEFMQAVWRLGPATAADVRQALERSGRCLSGGSVRKVLGILRRKGYVSRRKAGRTFVYQARVPEQQAREGFVKDLLGRVFGGSPAPLVAALLQAHEIDERELADIKELIERYEDDEGE